MNAAVVNMLGQAWPTLNAGIVNMLGQAWPMLNAADAASRFNVSTAYGEK